MRAISDNNSRSTVMSSNILEKTKKLTNSPTGIEDDE